MNTNPIKFKTVITKRSSAENILDAARALADYILSEDQPLDSMWNRTRDLNVIGMALREMVIARKAELE